MSSINLLVPFFVLLVILFCDSNDRMGLQAISRHPWRVGES